MVNQGDLNWKTLLKAWGTTLLIYSLSGLTPILMEWLLEGTISRIAAVSFIIGFWGVFSGGLIYILKQKNPTLDAGDMKAGQDAANEVQQIAAGQVAAGAESQKAIREEVKKVADDKSYNEDLQASPESEPESQPEPITPIPEPVNVQTEPSPDVIKMRDDMAELKAQIAALTSSLTSPPTNTKESDDIVPAEELIPLDPPLT